MSTRLIWILGAAAQPLGVLASHVVPPVPLNWTTSFEHLGVYAYHRNGSGENTPFRFKDRQYMMESAGGDFPGLHLNTGYFRIRDLGSGEVISSVGSSVNHSFFSAAVDYARDKVWVFGSAHDRVTRDAPCDMKPNHPDCYIGVWSSSDLLKWHRGPPLFQGSFITYDPLNVDVDFVQPSDSSSPAPLPTHQAVMMIESVGHNASQFAINTGTDGDLTKNWELLSSEHSTSALLNTSARASEVENCPSIRYDKETGYYYVIGGGCIITGPARSKSLIDWEVSPRAPITGPAHWLGQPLDNQIAAGMYTTEWQHGGGSERYRPYLANMTGWNFGTSDVDLSTNDGKAPTYINWIASTQCGPSGMWPNYGSNFGALGVYNGSVIQLLRSYFDD